MNAGWFHTWAHEKLLRFYPKEFREEFEGDMERDFRTRLRRSTPRQVPRIWLRTLADWLISMPREQLDVTARDLRFSLRSLRRSPLFTLVVALSLALGIGGASIVCTIANSLLVQTPLNDPSRFVGVLRGDGLSEPSFWPDYVDYRDRNRSFSSFAAENVMPVFLGRGRQSRSVMAETVTDNHFEMLAIRPFLGRLFTPGECRGGCPQEVILSYRYWRALYGGDPGIVGRQVPLSGLPATVIGIAPKGFDGLLAPVMTDIWIHVENRRLTDPELFTNRAVRWLAIGGRLKPGVSESQAVADLNRIDAQLRRENRYPENQERRLWACVKGGIAIPLLRKRVQAAVAVLGAAAGLLLLICCANVANMVLARAEAGRREMGLRRALGAGNSRLVRSSLTESLVLAILGGIGGLFLSFWATGQLPALQPPANDLYTYRLAIHQDYRVWVFTLVIGLGCSLLFGIAPALRAARAGCVQAIRNLDVQGRPRWFVRRGLVSCQVACSVVLLAAAGLFYRSFAAQRQIDPGFPVANGIVVPLNLHLVSYTGDSAKARRFYAAVKNRVQSLQGVARAALTSYVPLNAVPPAAEVSGDGPALLRATVQAIDPDYLGAMNVRLLGGRNFRDDDRDGRMPVALADERLVRRLWPALSNPLEALGRTLRRPGGKEPVRIVGVVASDTRFSLTAAPQPALFLPVEQRPSSMLYLVVRTSVRPEELMAPIGRAVESVDDTVSVRGMRTLETQLGDVLWPIRTGSRVIAAASILAALLAVVGLYGVVAYAMARRQREMGIRIALGARAADVLRFVLRDGLKMTLWGIVFGVPLALAVNTALARILYGLPALDPAAPLAATAAWVAIASGACLIPAWRALHRCGDAIREL